MPPVAISGVPWLDALLSVMGAWGYLAAFAGGVLENLFIAGSFIPGETVVMVVAAAASRDPHVSIVAVWFVSVIGTVIGSAASYAIGRAGGRPLIVALVGRFPRLTRGLADAEGYFEIHGTKTVFLARFTAGFKNFVPTLAGVSGMKLAPFAVYTILSAIVYSTGLCIVGFFFGANIDRALRMLSRTGLWAVLAVVTAVVLYAAYRHLKAARIDAEITGLDIEEAEFELMDGAPEPVGGDEDDETV